MCIPTEGRFPPGDVPARRVSSIPCHYQHRERSVLELHRDKEAAIGQRQKALENLKERVVAQV